MGSRRQETGFSLLELMVALSLTGILCGVSISQLRNMNNDLAISTNQVSAMIKLARSRAIATTSPYVVRPLGAFSMAGYQAESCDDVAPVLDTKIQMSLPTGVSFASTDWQICFTSRGIASEDVSFNILKEGGPSKEIEVMLGGAVRVNCN